MIHGGGISLSGYITCILYLFYKVLVYSLNPPQSSLGLIFLRDKNFVTQRVRCLHLISLL